MSKSSREQIEKDEKKILSELVKNSNKSIDMIAKDCGFSRQKVWRAMKQLESKGLIWGYTAIFDEEKIGLNHYMLLIKRTTAHVKEDTANKIISRLIDDMGMEFGITVESSMYVHGEYDWILTFTAEDIVQSKRFSDKLIAMHPGVIQKITIIQTLMAVKKQYIMNPDKSKLKEFL